MLLQDWLARARALGASDLHLESDTPAVVRVRGELQPLGSIMAADRMLQTAQDALGAEGWAQFLARGSADLALSLGALRCRASFYRTLRGVGIAVRLLTPSVRDLRACNLHGDFRRLLEASSGLVIISGPTGAGKSTTLAALIEEINGSRARHVITLESPLEYLFTNRHALIRQREVPTHTPSFEQGIIDALRENPDVLVIGEMRTPEVMRLTLTAAETGHLVLATMHAATCAEALQRLCLSFPAELQPSVRAQLADCLVGASCQRLEFLPAAQLRVPRCELLLPSTGARGTIRAGNFSQLANVLQSGAEEGMWSYARYQRWMEQQHDWVRSDQGVAMPDETGAPRAAPLPASPLPATTAGRTPAAGPRAPRRSADSTAADPDVVELPAEDIGPEELEELARQVSSRKP
ncbi:MAG TPA: ATPase, T2SS/T4P/T4SS family [Steroidobacteraceae bacterium]|nr:ATPase, T2SS/T4P/T4SS family [Steroidobacteraceae bacterium]